jgi:hypothetical protein
MVSIFDILSGAVPLMVDVRQTGGSPLCVGIEAHASDCTWSDRRLSGPVARSVRRLGTHLETLGDDHLAAYDQSLPTDVRAREQIMKFRADVEPTEPMRGLEVPEEVVEALGGGKRPPVTITINGHSWKSRIAIMRGRYLIGLSNANRRAAGVATGDEVQIEVELDVEPRVVVEPTDFAHALDADPVARAAYDRLSYSHKREHVGAIESAKKPETRSRRIEAAVANLRDPESKKVSVPRSETRATK